MSELLESDAVADGGPEVWDHLLPGTEALARWREERAVRARAQMQSAADHMQAVDWPAPWGWSSLENVR